MATLIITVLCGLIIAFFAIQNTETVTLHFQQYTVTSVPLYIVAISGLLVGLFLSWIISFVHSIATGFTIRGKESKIKDFKKENAELVKQIHKLELENAKLTAGENDYADDKSL